MNDELQPGLRPRADVEPPSNVLLFGPPERAPSLCAEHAHSWENEDLAVVAIEFPRGSGGLAAAWSATATQSPVAVKVISVGAGPRRTDERLVEQFPEDVTVETVEYGDDLVLVGVELAETLQSWQETYGQVVLCVDSLTPLVRLAGVDRAYRFLQALTEGVRGSDVRAHYHLDPSQHDLRTTYLLETFADAFVVAGDVEVGLPRG